MQSGIFRPSPLPLLLPTAHLAFCLYIQFNPSEGGWWWFQAFLVDLPFSILLLFISRLVPVGFVVFGVFGTLWWYF